jgi:GNAT superfamily N-acetyltransferase
MTGGGRPYIRPPLPDDARHILAMAQEFAAFHGDAATVTLYDIMQDICGGNPKSRVLLIETEDLVAGYSAGYFTYQIHKGRFGFEVQSLYIRDRHRGRGYGAALLRATARYALENGCQRVSLGADNGNEDAMRFYTHLGFKPARGGSWIQRYHLEGQELRNFVDGRP